MTIVIVGPGAIGCLMAGLLSRPDRDIQLLAGSRARADALRNGVMVRRSAGDLAIAPHCVSDAGVLGGEADALLFCVKAYDTVRAARQARPAAGAGTAIVSLQNGVGNLEALASEFGADRVVAAVTSLGAIREAPGVVRQTGFGPTTIAPFVAGAACAARVADLWRDSQLAVRTASDGVSAVWSKLVVSAAINPVTALHGVANGELPERADSWTLAVGAARETWAVARAMRLTLPFDDPVAETLSVCRATAGNRSSMRMDIEAGRRTEVREINGAVVAEGRARGVPVPTNERLLGAVLDCERISSGAISPR